MLRHAYQRVNRATDSEDSIDASRIEIIKNENSSSNLKITHFLHSNRIFGIVIVVTFLVFFYILSDTDVRTRKVRLFRGQLVKN